MTALGPLIVGLNNTRSLDPAHALFPAPAGCTGDRLVRMAVDVDPTFTVREYLNSFARMNLWPITTLPSGPTAREEYERAAVRVIHAATASPRFVLLLGTRVRAHVLKSDTVPTWFEPERVEGSRSVFFTLPHPSGRNLYYNRPAMRQRAGTLLVKLARTPFTKETAWELAQTFTSDAATRPSGSEASRGAATPPASTTASDAPRSRPTTARRSRRSSRPATT